MPSQDLTYDEVMRIVELVKTTQFREFRLKVGDIEVHLRRSNGAAPAAPASGHAVIAPADASVSHGETAGIAAGSALVRAPMVGTFYRAPAPDAAAYVEVGQHVEPDTVVGIIEVMKLMNTITAEVRGVVAQIFAANGTAVEHGEALLAICPDPEDG